MTTKEPNLDSEKVTLPIELVEKVLSQMEAAFESIRVNEKDSWPILETLKRELAK